MKTSDGEYKERLYIRITARLFGGSEDNPFAITVGGIIVSSLIILVFGIFVIYLLPAPTFTPDYVVDASPGPSLFPIGLLILGGLTFLSTVMIFLLRRVSE